MNKRAFYSIFLAFVGLLVAVVIAVNSFGSKRDLFDVVSDSMISNTNFDKVVFWARETLKQTNNLPDHGYVEIGKENLPEALNGLYQGPNAHITIPHVYIYKMEGNGHYIAITYLPGSTYRFAIFIGDKYFELPAGRIKKYRKPENGVFITGNW